MIRILDLGFELWGHYILVSATVTGLVAWEACLMFAAVMIKVLEGRFRNGQFGLSKSMLVAVAAAGIASGRAAAAQHHLHLKLVTVMVRSW